MCIRDRFGTDEGADKCSSPTLGELRTNCVCGPLASCQPCLGRSAGLIWAWLPHRARSSWHAPSQPPCGSASSLFG
eukprot:8913291-Alexandrium_andersonii.AAC.1